VTRADSDEWLSLSAAAAMLGVHPSTLRTWADRGDLPTHRTPGRHRRFRRSDIEAWAAARNEAREARPPAGQVIVQHALGRTRMQMAEGRLNSTPWYQQLDEARKREFRDVGRRLLSVLMRYLGEEDDPTPLVAEGRAIGCEYERLGHAAGLSLTEKVNSFLYFRDFLYDSVLDVYQASGQRAAREWAAMHRRIAGFTNAVLLALVEAHEKAGQPQGLPLQNLSKFP
jgi:excisionase family DNA binding protein